VVFGKKVFVLSTVEHVSICHWNTHTWWHIAEGEWRWSWSLNSRRISST